MSTQPLPFIPDAADVGRYAQLIVRLGVNLQPGNWLLVRAAVETAPLVRSIAEAAYAAGARRVVVDWEEPFIEKLRLIHAPEDVLAELAPGRAELYEAVVQDGAPVVTIHAPSPGLLADVDPSRVAAATTGQQKALRRFREALQSNQVRWTIVGYPSADWAKAVFPDAAPSEGIERLWACILRASRIDTDPVAAWTSHVEQLQRRLTQLNEARFKRLYYQGPGTDLVVELPDEHVWLGGDASDPQGIRFLPNIPTEEVFTLPHRDGVNGTVRASKPLNLNGQVIADFSLTFRDGRVVDASAGTGQEALEHLLETDEGARRLGEVALVPEDSPIAQMGIVFHNTLFDENASCHLALGAAYADCLEGGTDLSPEERARRGANESLTHVDFMVGSSEVDIDGETADGRRIPLMRKGRWAQPV